MALSIDGLDIASVIRAYRLHENLSQNAMAARMGITGQQLGQYELGHRMPSMRTLRRLVAIGVPPADIGMAVARYLSERGSDPASRVAS